MTNPNVPGAALDTSVNSADFQAWQTEFEPFGADMLIETTPETPGRTLACSSPADYAIMDISPESVDVLSLS